MATCLALVLTLSLGTLAYGANPKPFPADWEKVTKGMTEKELEAYREAVCVPQPTSSGPVPPGLIELCGHKGGAPTETPRTLVPEVQRGPIILGQVATPPTISTASIASIATLVSFATMTPSPATDFQADLELLPADPNAVYQITSSGAVSKYDANGVQTAVSVVAPPAGQTWNDIAVDPTTGTVYGTSAVCGTTTTLSTLDLLLGTSVPIGTVTGAPCIIGLAADNAGNLWGYDVTNDRFFGINKLTGAGTNIGAIGFDASFGQAMDTDPATGTVYMFAFNNTTFRPELRSVNTVTGASTLVSPIGLTSPGGSPQIAGGVFGSFPPCVVDADCQDGNACNGAEICGAGGICGPGTPVDCSDGLFCTQDICAPVDGSCSHPANLCNDGNPCTNDTCDEDNDACVNAPNGNCVEVCTGPITILDNQAGAPYPSNNVVAVAPGSYNVALVKVVGLTHTFPDDLDVMLQGPGGSNLLLMSDVGGGGDVVSVNFDFADSAASTIPDGGPLVAGTFRPSNVDTTTDVFPAPAPAPSAATQLAIFNFSDPNGSWRLWVRDDATGDTGTMTQWCIRFTANLCNVDADCNDNNLCTTDSCNTTTHFCNAPAPINCADGEVCTIDNCNPASGCFHTPDPCNDGDGCTNDTCDSLGCHHSPACMPETCNTAPIAILDNAAGSPYPSNIVVGGGPTSASVASVKILGYTHSFPDDLDISVQGPGGQATLIESDAGGGTDIAGVNLTFSDAAATGLPDGTVLVSGTFKPTNFEAAIDAFPAPAPAVSTVASLSVFTGTDPNGTWKLWVRDDATGDTGSLAGGWCLNVGPCALPLEINDSLRVSKSGATANISWTDNPGPYNVYRGSATGTFAYNHGCFAAGVAAPPTLDADPVATGSMSYYLVARRNGCGGSVIGRKSNSDPVPAGAPICP